MKFLIHASPYQHVIFFVLGEDPMAARKWLKGCGVTMPEIQEMQRHIEEGTPHGTCFTTCGNDIVLWLKEKPERASCVALLAHELHHAVSQIMRRVGIPPNHDTEEAHAYLLQDLMFQVLKRVWK
jgi:hypothetical protein